MYLRILKFYLCVLATLTPLCDVVLLPKVLPPSSLAILLVGLEMAGKPAN